jgi:hypothetical protein
MSDNKVDDELASAFRIKFGIADASAETIAKLLGTRNVAPWYADYKSKRSTEKKLPEEWRKAGLRAEDWVSVEQSRIARGKIRAKHSDATKLESERYKAKIASLEVQRDAELSSLDSPILAIIEAGYQDLTLAAQARIESKSGDDRTTQEKIEVANYRKSEVSKLYASQIGGESN